MARLGDILKILATPCSEATRLISRAQDEHLEWPLRAAIRTHTLYCSKCRRFREQLRVVRDALTKAGDPSAEAGGLQLSPQARQRIAAALGEAGESK